MSDHLYTLTQVETAAEVAAHLALLLDDAAASSYLAREWALNWDGALCHALGLGTLSPGETARALRVAFFTCESAATPVPEEVCDDAYTALLAQGRNIHRV